MSLPLALSVYHVFTDKDGQPLENGYIYIGNANIHPQASPIAVYWDAAATIPAVQPIRTIDGYPAMNGAAGNLYVAAQNFSILVQDKHEATVFLRLTSLEYEFGIGLITSYLSPPTGANLIGYSNGLLGMITTRTVQDRLRETIYARDFGCIGNGIIDDTINLQGAIDACGYTRTLHLGDGIYKVACGAGAIAISAYCAIVGHTPLRSVIYNTGAGSAITFLGSPPGSPLSGQYYAKWANFQVKGNGFDEDGIVISNNPLPGYEVAYSSFESVWSTYHGRDGWVHRMAWGSRYIDCKSHQNGYLGWRICRDAGPPPDMAGATATTMVNCDCRWNGNNGNNTGNFDRGGVKLIGNVAFKWLGGVCESNNAWNFIIGDAVDVYPPEQIVIDGAHFEDTPPSISTSTIGGHIYATNDWENLKIINCWGSYGGSVGATGYAFYISSLNTPPTSYPSTQRLFFEDNNWLQPSGAGGVAIKW